MAFTAGLSIALVPAFKRSRKRALATAQQSVQTAPTYTRLAPQRFDANATVASTSSSAAAAAAGGPTPMTPDQKSAANFLAGFQRPEVGISHEARHGVTVPPGVKVAAPVIVTAAIPSTVSPPATQATPAATTETPAQTDPDEEDEYGFPLDPIDQSDPAHEGPPLSPFFALQAFGIATGLVLVFGGGIVYATSQYLDVDSVSFSSVFRFSLLSVCLHGSTCKTKQMEAFTAEMRRLTGRAVGGYGDQLYKSVPEDPSVESDAIEAADNDTTSTPATADVAVVGLSLIHI